MLQPFELFQAKYIPRLKTLKKRYLVSQTYHRGMNSLFLNGKTALLITDYDDIGLAKIHYNAVKQDKYAAIIDLESENHLSKLNGLLSTQSKYIVYWSIVKDATAFKKLVNAKCKDNMRRYIDANTNWRIQRDTTIYPNVEVTFGELFITIKHGGQQIRLKFEEIEKS